MLKEIFCEEIYDVQYSNNNKIYHISKDKQGFEITLTLSGTPEEKRITKDIILNFIAKNI